MKVQLKKEWSTPGLYFLILISILCFLMGSTAKAQNSISSLPLNSYANPDTVTSISLKSSGLTRFPKELFRFKNLEMLDLSDNALNEVPVDIDQLSNLRFFDISKNNIEELPASFSRLKNLSSIYLGGNPSLNVEQIIETIPSENIRQLDLQNDNIVSIPKSISRFKNLEKLNLSGNPIAELPLELSSLPRLQVLYLNNDPYFDINKNLTVLSSMKNLEELHLEKDEISAIPEELLTITSLKYLYLNNNNLQSLPDFTPKELKSLVYVDLSKNPIPKLAVEGIENRLAPTIRINFSN